MQTQRLKTKRFTPAQERVLRMLRRGYELRALNLHGCHWLSYGHEKNQVSLRTVRALVRAGALRQMHTASVTFYVLNDTRY